MAENTTATPAQRRSGRILLVEDSGMVRAILGKILANVGFHDVLMADSGASAFRLLGMEDGHPGEEIDLVLMDFMLPDTDGIAAIKARDELQSVPILMVTAAKDPVTLKTAFEAGAIDYIIKPVNDFDLLARVGSALRLKAEIDQRVAREQELIEVTQQLARANRQLEQLSLTDALTGTANRRNFDQALQMEWSRAARGCMPLALVLIDIDHFKRYNDTYGHQEGDHCLRQVAAALARGILRPGDLVARYGGEEFAVILANTDLAGARQVGERLRNGVAALAIPHTASSVCPTVTLSVGIAVHSPGDYESAAALVKAADRALYQAKESGRNRIETAERGAALVAGGVGK